MEKFLKQPKSLLSRKEEVYVFKEDKEKVLDSHQLKGESCRPEKNRRRSMRVTTSQYEISGKNKAHLLGHNLPAEKKIHWNKQHFGTR